MYTNKKQLSQVCTTSTISAYKNPYSFDDRRLQNMQKRYITLKDRIHLVAKKYIYFLEMKETKNLNPTQFIIWDTRKAKTHQSRSLKPGKEPAAF